MAKHSGKAYLMISAVAQRYDIHPQTLRLYEREGLLKPSRTEGNTRVYSEEDLEQLETILAPTRDLGVNLAGVEIILNVRAKMEAMQRQVEEFIATVNEEISSRARAKFEPEPKNMLIPVTDLVQASRPARPPKGRRE